MKKIILGLAATAAIAAPVALAAPANARRRRPSGTVTFTMTEPAGAFDQFGNVWTHVAQVTVNADGSSPAPAADQRRRRHQLDDQLPPRRSPAGSTPTARSTSPPPDAEDGASWSLDHAVADSLTENLGTVVRATPATT